MMFNRTCEASKRSRSSLLAVLTVSMSFFACYADSVADQPIAPLADIVLPPGFNIEVFSDDVPGARTMVMGDNGTIFVSSRRAGTVYALLPQEGESPEVIAVVSDRRMPSGIAFFDGDLYVADITSILKFNGIESHLRDVPAPSIINASFPNETHHGARFLAVGPDKKLYISIGAPCNICNRRGFGNITRLNLDGSGRHVYAEGIRNSVGLTWHPETRDLWFTDNGRDQLGDDRPPGELNRATRAGQHFGYPYCHGGDIADPEFGAQRDCSEFVPPAQKLDAHVAPLGLKFYTGEMFPEEYRGQLFIAEHGSWNRSKKSGYRVSLVRLRDGEPVRYETFAEGWLRGEEVSGRPVDILFLPDGSMLISDDNMGRIYRISYSRSQE